MRIQTVDPRGQSHGRYAFCLGGPFCCLHQNAADPSASVTLINHERLNNHIKTLFDSRSLKEMDETKELLRSFNTKRKVIWLRSNNLQPAPNLTNVAIVAKLRVQDRDLRCVVRREGSDLHAQPTRLDFAI